MGDGPQIVIVAAAGVIRAAFRAYFSATTARLMADMITDITPAVDMTAFRINRY
ncbi:hypothetical protein [Rhizobium sp. BK376]|jgi:hypothetical protein|uniref:hypothetical protein n=1 Tax=Rhizobium sp. BK376 TaxID=2512149 RepID=UPI001404E857|nr:hypothetical protein [Rhizobium sp. BK376]